MRRENVTLLEVVLKTAVAHTVTYFLVGLVAFFWFDYARLFAETELRFLMRPVSDPMVAAGPLFQPPKKKWLDWCLGIAFILVLLMSILGLLANRADGHAAEAESPASAGAAVLSSRVLQIAAGARPWISAASEA